MRRASDHDVRLLANQLPFVKPGSLLDAIEGRADWSHNVFRLYWPLARSDSFQPAHDDGFHPLRSEDGAG